MTSTVIKSTGPHRPADALPFRFDEMDRHAATYLDTVRAAAAKIISEAKHQAADIRKSAERDGQQAAVEAARRILDEKVTRQLETLLPALRQAVDSLAHARAEWLGAWEQNVVHLAAAIAARVIRRELSQQPEIPLAFIREALELASGSPELTIRLHPDDHATLAPHIPLLTSQLARRAKAQIVADATITAGGCRIDTQFGSIDQQIETQLARIEQELT
jgi:flagellar assembly protein FliH